MDLFLIISMGVTVIFFIGITIYSSILEPKLTREEREERIRFQGHIKEYKKFMSATGKNTLKDISLEFNENMCEVEQNIRRAIKVNLLDEYYLCNQTGEILPIKSNSLFAKQSITIKENRSIKIKE